MAQSEQKTAYVLVVEDNAVSLAACEKVLASIRGCVAKCFSKPAEALAWAAAVLPALVLVDYAMPEMDGLEFIRAFRSIPGRNTVPCVVLTAVRDASVEREAMQLGVVDFLLKPASIGRLVELVTQALAKRL